MDPAREDNLNQRYRTTAIICAAMFGALFVYAIVAYVVSTNGVSVDGAPRTLLPVFGVIALVAFGVSFPLAKVPVNAALKRLVIIVQLPDDEKRELGIQPGADVANVLGGPDVIPAALQTGTILAYALSEMPALLGFVMFIMSSSWLIFAAFLGLSIAGFALNFPRLSTWRAHIERAETAATGQTTPIVTS